MVGLSGRSSRNAIVSAKRAEGDQRLDRRAEIVVDNGKPRHNAAQAVGDDLDLWLSGNRQHLAQQLRQRSRKLGQPLATFELDPIAAFAAVPRQVLLHRQQVAATAPETVNEHQWSMSVRLACLQLLTPRAEQRVAE